MAEWPRMVALEGSGCPPPYTGRQAETRSRFQRLLRARVARDGLRSHPGDRGGSARGMERGRSPPRAPVAGTEDSTLASCVSSGVVCRGFLLVFFFAGLTEGPPSVPPPGICGPCPDAPAMGPLSRPRVECPGSPNFSRATFPGGVAIRAPWRESAHGVPNPTKCLYQTLFRAGLVQDVLPRVGRPLGSPLPARVPAPVRSVAP